MRITGKADTQFGECICECVQYVAICAYWKYKKLLDASNICDFLLLVQQLPVRLCKGIGGLRMLSSPSPKG